MNTKTIAENRVVRHEYFIIESYEAGIELFGTEVKSIRNGGVNLKDSWISIENGEAVNCKTCTSPPMKRGTSSTRIPTGRGSS